MGIDGESGSGGGPSYVLPIATETILGGVKPDGATTFVDPVTGILTAPAGAPYSLPIANAVTLGGVKPDDTTVQVDPLTGVLSVIPSTTEPEVSGYSEGGYTEFSWINQSGDILGQSSLQNGTNLFRIQDFIDGMILKFRWIGRLDSMNTAQTTFIEGLIGGDVMGQFDITPPATNGDYNVSYEATIYASSVGVSSTSLWIQSRVDFSRNGSDPSATLYSHTRYWTTASFANGASVPVGVTITRLVAGGYRQYGFHAWMENAQRSSTPDPATIFQPLEDQRLSTSNSVEFVGLAVRNLVSNTTERSTTSVDPSLTMMTEHSGTGTDTETLPYAIGSRELRIYQNDGTKAWTLLCAGADVVRVPDPLATATSTLVYPGNTRWMYDSAPGIWKIISPGPFLPLFAGELNPVTGQCWFGSPTSSGGIVIRTNISGTGTANIDYYGGVDGKRRFTLRYSDLANAYTIQTSNDDGSARLDRIKIPRDSDRNMIFAGGVGHNVTTRTTTSATSTLAGITRYTGTGGHTEPLPAATVVGEVREYRNSGTGPWTLQRAGSDQIDAGNPSALVTSITLLPGQSARLYVATVALWESL